METSTSHTVSPLKVDFEKQKNKSPQQQKVAFVYGGGKFQRMNLPPKTEVITAVSSEVTCGYGCSVGPLDGFNAHFCRTAFRLPVMDAARAEQVARLLLSAVIMAPANDGASGFTADGELIRSAPPNTAQQDPDVPRATAVVTRSSGGQFNDVGCGARVGCQG